MQFSSLRKRGRFGVMGSLPRPSGAERASRAHLERLTSPVKHGFRERYEKGKAEMC